MRKMFQCLAILALSATIAGAVDFSAQEKLTLVTPVYVDPGVVEFWPESLYMKREHPDAPAEIRAVMRELIPGTTLFKPNGRSLICRYDGATAQNLINQVGRPQTTTESLDRRIVKKCQTDNQLPAGTISGSPE
jgi:hypothetical protein